MRELPEGAEWATSPLLDKSNVGKYVWTVWNSNTKFASVNQIVKIGRTNIHVETNAARPESYNVVDVEYEGHGYGTKNGFNVSCYTEQARIDRDERLDLVARYHKAERRVVRLPLAALRRIVEEIEQELA